MNRLAFGLVLLVVALALSGCATLSKAECEAGDWKAIGYADGLAGYPLSRLSDHGEACADHGVGVDRDLYEAGRAEGLELYCTPEHAAEAGLSGRTNYHICGGERGVSFERVYAAAEEVREIEQEIEVQRSRISSLSGQLADPGLTPEDRVRIASELQFAQFELNDLGFERRRAKRRLREIQSEETLRLAQSEI